MPTNPPILGTAVTGWRYAFAAFSRMPGMLGIGMALLLIINFLTLPLLWRMVVGVPSLWIQFLGFVVAILQGYLLAPVAIAVHRFVLLGETEARYSVSPSDARFMRFFYFAVVVQLIVTIPAALMTLGPEVDGMAGVVLVLVFLVVLIVALIVVLRMLILFPAIAVDAAGADWRNAMADARGHSWRIFFIVLLAAIPAMLAGVPAQYLLSDPAGPGWGAGIALAAVQAVMGVLMLAALAAVASQLFAAYANRLNGQGATTAA